VGGAARPVRKGDPALEFGDYVAILRRRWLPFAAVSASLFLILTVWSLTSESSLYVAESKIGILEEYRIFTPTELAQFITTESTGYGYYTREALVNSPQVYQMAAAVYLVFRDRKEMPSKEVWRSREDGPMFRLLEEQGLMDPRLPGPTRLVEERLKEATSRLRASIRTSKPSEKIQLIHVRASSPDPREAVLMANAFARGAQIYSRLQATAILDEAGRDIERRIQRTRDRLEAHKIESGVTEEDLRELERQIGLVGTAVYDLEKQMEETRTRQDRARARIAALEAAEHRLREILPLGSEGEPLSSPLLDRLREDLAGLRTEVEIKKLSWTPENPDYKKMVLRQEQLQKELREELYRVRAQTLVSLRESISDLEIERRNLEERRLKKSLELRELQEQLQRKDPKRAEIVQMRKELDGYEDVRRRLESARALQQGFYVFEEVAEPDSVRLEERRRVQMIPLFFALALMVGFAAAFLLEYLDTTLRTDYDVKRHLNLPCLATVEDVGTADPAILRASPLDPLSERFNVAATVLRSYLTEREYKSFLVCSAVPQEGKTTVAANLAVALARKGLRVILVDTDLRLPRLHEIFALDNATGLSNYLRGEEVPLESLVAFTEIPSLRVLPAGPPAEAPVEMMESARLADLVRSLRDQYDVVICDSPPLSSAGDTLVLARLVDTTVLVVGSGLSDRRTVTWAKQLLVNVRADIGGVVLNFAPRGFGTGVYYYYESGHPKRVRSRG